MVLVVGRLAPHNRETDAQRSVLSEQAIEKRYLFSPFLVESLSLFGVEYANEIWYVS